MYLSKLILNSRHPQARRDPGDAYEMHRTLSRAYAVDADTPVPRFLWRLEPGTDIDFSATLLVQSDVSANWSVLDSMPGYSVEVLGNKPVDLQRLIETGVSYRFRLLANPTVTRNGKRYGLTREEGQFAWLSRQGEKHGFAVTACQRLRNERIETRQGRTNHRISVHSVLFEGLLKATDTERMRLAVNTGLGHGKALGLGMLSVARVAV